MPIILGSLCLSVFFNHQLNVRIWTFVFSDPLSGSQFKGMEWRNAVQQSTQPSIHHDKNTAREHTQPLNDT